MSRLISGFLLLLSFCNAYAQTPEPPVEHASGVTVAAFVILFVGGCLGYVWYAWWSGRKEERRKGKVRVEPNSPESH